MDPRLQFHGQRCGQLAGYVAGTGFEEKLKTAEEEIALAAKTDFNAIRTLLDYVVWREQHDGFLERLDRFLDVIYKYGISFV